MGTFNLGNVVGILHSETAPTKTNILWGKILNPSFPLIVEIYYWDDLASAWVLVQDPTTNYWLRPVISNVIGTPPGSPNEGDRYLIPNSGTTGAWIGNENKIAEYKTAAWQYVTPIDGYVVTVSIDANKLYVFEGLWGGGGLWAVWDFQVPIAPGTYIPQTEKGIPLGVVDLDASTEIPNAYINEDAITYNPTTPGNWPVGTDTILEALDHIITAVGAGLPDAPSDGSTYGRKDAAWAAVPANAAAGAATNIQYNTANAFDASADFTYNDTDKYLRAGSTITHTAAPSNSIMAGQDLQTIGVGSGKIQWSAIFGDVFRYDNAGTLYHMSSSLVGGSGNIIRIANAATGIDYSSMWGQDNLIEPGQSGNYGHTLIGGDTNISRHSHQNISGTLVDASGLGAFVHGLGWAPTALLADGDWSVNMSRNTAAQVSLHGALADDSTIIGGINHNIPSDSERSAIIGGNAIKAAATLPDTVYVPQLRVGQGTAAAIIQNDAETQVAVIDSTTGQIKWRASSTLTGGAGTPGGSDTEVQYNDTGAFGAAANFTFAAGVLTLGLTGANARTVISNTGTVYTYGTAGALAAQFDMAAGVSGVMVLSDAGTAKIRLDSVANADSYFNSGGSVGFQTATPNALVGADFAHTGGILIRGGATGTRPATPVAGMLRYNDTLDDFEGYTTAGAWGGLGTVDEAPSTGIIYGRKDAAWVNNDTAYWNLAGTTQILTGNVGIDMNDEALLVIGAAAIGTDNKVIFALTDGGGTTKTSRSQARLNATNYAFIDTQINPANVAEIAMRTVVASSLTEVSLLGGEGLVYSADYSGGYVIRSLVDKGFIEGAGAAQLDRVGLNLTTGDVATPAEGQIWYNNTTNKFRAFENAAAVDMIGGGSGWAVTGTTTLTGNVIIDGDGVDFGAAGKDLTFLDMGNILIDQPVNSFSTITIAADGALTLWSISDEITLDTTPSGSNIKLNSGSNILFQTDDVTRATITNTAMSFINGFKTTHNPDATNAGVNLGAHTADPSAPVDGDVYLNTTANELRARVNGAWIDLGGAGGGTIGGTIADDQLAFGNGTDAIQGTNEFAFNSYGLSFQENSTTVGQAPLTLSRGGTSTNTLHTVLDRVRNTSGTAATSFGLRDLWTIENAVNVNKEAAALDIAWTNASSGNEDARMRISTMWNGTLTTTLDLTPELNRFYHHTLFTSIETIGAGTLFRPSASTNVTRDGFTVQMENSSGIGGIGLGAGILFAIEGASGFQDAGRTSIVSTDATAAAMDAKFVLELSSGGSFQDVLVIDDVGNFTYADGGDFILGTTTGTKIGTGTTQKLSFWDATPVVQPIHIADATDAATVITQLNLLLADMATVGLQAAS